MGDTPLELRQDLTWLRKWMETQRLTSLWDISIWGNDQHRMWLGWGIGNYPPELVEEWEALKLCLQGKSPLKKRGKDKRGWGGNSGAYTTATRYHLIKALPTVPPNPGIWKAIWSSKTIPKIDMFTWTLAHKSILTVENLRKRGWEGPYRCPLCCHSEETIDHLLINCDFPKEV
jgi:hypothetical protein